MIRNDNPLTAELHRQIMNVIHHTVTAIPVGEGWSWDEYKTIKMRLLSSNSPIGMNLPKTIL